MKKARRKLLKYSLILIPLVLLFVDPFSESLKRRFLNRYDLRWHSTQDSGRRVQEIIVHNSGDSPVGKVRIQLDLTQGSSSPIADFNFTKFKSDGRASYQASFLDSLAGADLVNAYLVEEDGAGRPDINTVASALDAHAPQRTLAAVEREFDKVLESRLRSGNHRKDMVDEVKRSAVSFAKWHPYIKEKCDEKKYTDEFCRQAGLILERWEALKRHLASQARKHWSETAGAEVTYESGLLSPSGYADFTFSLDSRETGFLMINYDPDPSAAPSAKANVTSSSAVGYANGVMQETDTEAPLPVFMFKYHFWLLALIFIGTIVVVSFAWPEIRPKQLLPINRVIHQGLYNDDYEDWEHIYQRHRFYVLQQFRKFRYQYGKPHLDDDAEELLDYVRNQLTKEYHQNPTRFKAKWLRTEARLNRFIQAHLRLLVISSA